MRNLTPFYNVRTKDQFAHLPKGMQLLEAKIDAQKEAVPGWFLKMGETLDLNDLVHDDYLVQKGLIPADDVIVASSLALRGLLFVLKVGNKSTYFQTPLPSAVALGRSTEPNDDAQYLYGLNFSSSIGANPQNPDAYYQLSVVFDTRSGKVVSASKVKVTNKDVEGELSIIGYLLSGKLDAPVVAEPLAVEEVELADDPEADFDALMALGQVVGQAQSRSDETIASVAVNEIREESETLSAETGSASHSVH
jgi:hypothetical protein